MSSSNTPRPWMPIFAAVLPNLILFVTLLSIPLATAQGLGLAPDETSSWILVLWGLPGVLGLALTIYYRQPILLTGNVFSMIFVGTLGGDISYPELVGAFMLAGVIVTLVMALGLTERLAEWIPTPIVFGLLASAILPFFTGVFTAIGVEPLMVGGAFVAYLISRRVLGARIPPTLPALIIGLVLAAFSPGFGDAPDNLSLPAIVFTAPEFSLNAIASATPVLVILMTLQANVPSVIFMRNEGYQPPDRMINGVSGVATLLGSVSGPVAVSLSLPATSLVAGPLAGELSMRHRAVYISSSALIVIAILAGLAAAVPEVIPLPLLLALAGLAVIDVFVGALQQVTRGPLILGPLFTFVVALSDISLLDLGPFFWALVIGVAVALLLEPDKLQSWRAEAKAVAS